MIKKFLIMLGVTLFVMPSVVSAESTVTYDEVKDMLVANGVAITIELDGTKTVATWEGGEQELTDKTVVIGGAFNPTGESVNIANTSITMNSGKIGKIIGGNLIEKETGYTSIKNGTINVTVNGGTVSSIFGLTSGSTALGASVYSKIKTFYTADTVNVTVSGENTAVGYIIGTSSYTYIKNLNITVEDGARVTDDFFGIYLGSNGHIDNAMVIINEGIVGALSAGSRAMVESWNTDIYAGSEVNTIYAGSAYPEEEWAESWPANYGKVQYGQVGEMAFNIDENVKFGNIYAGFQYIDKEAFAEKYADEDGNLPEVAVGLENSEEAPITVNTASAPEVVDNSSVFNAYEADFVTINYITKTVVEEIDPEEEVEVATPGILDKDQLAYIQISDELVLEQLAEGEIPSIELVMEVIEEAQSAELFEEELGKNDKVVGYFDIQIVINGQQGVLGNITELTDEIELIAMLPSDLEEVKEGYVRTYYILRSHYNAVTDEYEVEKLEAELSEDGKYVTFASDKYSEYALVYTDTVATTDTTVPNTYDGISTMIIISAIMALGVLVSGYNLKKRFN